MAADGTAVSTVSTVIGFVSFAFTVSIFLRSFWEAFQTLGSAPQQIQDALSNLRYELTEEREYLRRARKLHHTDVRRVGTKTHRIYVHGETLRAINASVKDMLREFREMENPFLLYPHPKEEDSDVDLALDPHRPLYRCDLYRRVLWLNKRPKVTALSDRLEHLQVRRIAKEVTTTHLSMQANERFLRSLDDRVWAMEVQMRNLRVARRSSGPHEGR
ncbi:MAG: hypothetical protein M1838_000924 [Thelocarpon superellum]|nr:MAG: hypothetical protein M1838_000924 [Thelocarpon superellum]